MLFSYLTSLLLSLLPNQTIHFEGRLQLDRQAPLISAPNGTFVPNQYIVVLKNAVTPEGIEFKNHMQSLKGLISEKSSDLHSNKIIHVYKQGLVGYSGYFDNVVLNSIRKSKEVDYIEKDQIVSVADTQSGAPWGLARISHRDPLNAITGDKYIYNPSAGQGVTAYVVDTGIYIQHSDFEGRAFWGKTLVAGQPDNDGNGHGTHVAGIIASKTFGVAKKAKLVAVKVFDDNKVGYISNVIAGIQYTVSDYTSRKIEALKMGLAPPKSVGNLSLSSSFSQALNSAVSAAVSSGIVYTVAAGNSARNACDYSPASEKSAITVGSTDVTDVQSYFSNYGSCVDIMAPGRAVISTWIGSNAATKVLSGTSMASPHVAGIAAYIISQNNNILSPSSVRRMIITSGTMNKLSNLGAQTPNILAYNSPPSS
ncbi:Subtilisin-like protease [Smittium mucronatum]|uniref:Subtilisin-like protease n=1 Tax=Smittium mucronatum TaxID=133383 RepID=A0A1R0GP43_9FUNG|nr:Subtilisin-like protease [Smittium mucronatum]